MKSAAVIIFENFEEIEATAPIDILRRDLDKIKYGTSTVNKQEKMQEQNVITARENGNIRAIKFILGSLMFKKNFIMKNIDYKKLLPKYVDIIEKALEHINENN